MIIKNGKIIKTTESELYSYWLKQWSDLYSFNDYKKQCIDLGTEVVNEEMCNMTCKEMNEWAKTFHDGLMNGLEGKE